LFWHFVDILKGTTLLRWQSTSFTRVIMRSMMLLCKWWFHICDTSCCQIAAHLGSLTCVVLGRLLNLT
jgi:hypothetical protein